MDQEKARISSGANTASSNTATCLTPNTDATIIDPNKEKKVKALVKVAEFDKKIKLENKDWPKCKNDSDWKPFLEGVSIMCAIHKMRAVMSEDPPVFDEDGEDSDSELLYNKKNAYFYIL